VTPPSGLTVSVDEGAVVNAAAITLLVSAAGAAEMFLDGDFADGPQTRAWVPFATRQPMTLVPDDGPKAIQVWVRDLAFNEAQRVTLIVLDTTPPSVTPSLVPPAGQLAIKGGDTVSFAGTAEPGTALVSARIIDEASATVANVTSALSVSATTGAISGSATLGILGATELRLEVVVTDGANASDPALGRSSPVAVTSTPVSSPALELPAGQSALKSGDLVGASGTVAPARGSSTRRAARGSKTSRAS
jgi:hypothetical protein